MRKLEKWTLGQREVEGCDELELGDISSTFRDGKPAALPLCPTAARPRNSGHHSAPPCACCRCDFFLSALQRVDKRKVLSHRQAETAGSSKNSGEKRIGTGHLQALPTRSFPVNNQIPSKPRHTHLLHHHRYPSNEFGARSPTKNYTSLGFTPFT